MFNFLESLDNLRIIWGSYASSRPQCYTMVGTHALGLTNGARLGLYNRYLNRLVSFLPFILPFCEILDNLRIIVGVICFQLAKMHTGWKACVELDYVGLGKDCITGILSG